MWKKFKSSPFMFRKSQVFQMVLLEYYTIQKKKKKRMQKKK